MPKKDAGDERPGREQQEDPRHERERRAREAHEREEREREERKRDSREGEEREAEEREHGGGEVRPPREERSEGEQEPPRRRRMGREHAVHQQIIERRLGGGAPATPEAYAKGLEEWHKLRGSIVRPPSDEKPAMEPKTEGGGEEDKENRS